MNSHVSKLHVLHLLIFVILDYFNTTFDVPSGDPVILDLKCIGNESNILNCVNDTIPISSGGGSSGDADTCTSFAIARCREFHSF